MSVNTTTNFDSTPVWKGALSVFNSGRKNVKYNLLVKIHTPKGDFNVLKVIEYQEYNDYVKQVYGSIHLSFHLGMGDYVHKLYPFRDILEVTVKKVPQNDTGIAEVNEEYQAIRYRAILDLTKNVRATGERITQIGYETLNQSQPVTVNLELLDRNQELLRVAITEGDIYPQVTMKQVISAVMTGESNKLRLDGKGVIEGFNLVEPDNSMVIPNIHIPSMKVGLVPTYLQEKSLGVYSTGMGTHYQRVNNIPSWYVYSLFDCERFDSDVERMVIYAIPQDRASGLDRTFRKEGKILYVVATGQRNYTDDSQLGDLNQGVGFRMPNATGIFNGGAEMTLTGPVADRARLNTEVGTRKRPDGVYYAPMLAPSNNPFKQYSQLAARMTSQLNVVWENSYPDYVYPGMPCKYIFMDGEEYRELKGVILGRYTVSNLIGGSVTSSTYRQATHLGVCLEYYEDIPAEQPTSESPGVFK